MITISTLKKNKNDPNQKSSNKSIGVSSKQTRPKESSYCENNCKDVGVCEKYRNYMERMKKRAGHGIVCNK